MLSSVGVSRGFLWCFHCWLLVAPHRVDSLLYRFCRRPRRHREAARDHLTSWLELIGDFLPRVAPSVEHEQRRCFNVRRLHVTFVYISCHSLFHYTLYRCRQPGNIITSHKDTPLDFSLTSHQSTIATIVRVYLEKIMCVYNNVNVKTLH